MNALALSLIAAVALSGAPSSGPKKTQLKLDIKPADVVVYVDGVKKGKAGKLKTLNVKPGMHLIKLVHNKDQHQEPVSVKAGQALTWKFEFEDDKPTTVRNTTPSDESPRDGAPEPDSAMGGAGNELNDPDMPKD